MRLEDKEKRKVQMLHSIDSFGILRVSLSNIRIEGLEDRIKPGVPFPHKHDFFQVLLVTKGKGVHRIDFKQHVVRPNQVFLMKPGQMHSWNFDKGVKGYLVEFNFQSLNASKDSSMLIHNFSLSPDVFYFQTNREFKTLVALCEIMKEEFELRREMHDLCLQGYLNSFLIQIIRSYQSQLNPPKTLTTIEKFKGLIEKHYKEAHSVEFYANELGTSPKALTMQLSRSIGRPPRAMIQERILLEAKRYLAFTDLSVAEIGYELGFEDANYFTRFFRQHENLSPNQFRKESN